MLHSPELDDESEAPDKVHFFGFGAGLRSRRAILAKLQLLHLVLSVYGEVPSTDLKSKHEGSS